MSAKSHRLLNIYALLKQRPVTIEYLKTWANKNNIAVSERTFYRDLTVLESSVLTEGEHIIVSIGEKNKKTWKIEYRGDDKLTEFDINSYLLFRNFLPRPLVESRIESLHRIEEIFYKTYSKSRFEDYASYSEKQLQSTRFGEFHGEESYAKTLQDTLWAIRNHREIEIIKADFDITSISESVEFPIKFLPLKLIYHRGVVHVGGFEKEQKKLIILALSQITKYRLTNASFKNEKLLQDFGQEMRSRFGITENRDDKTYDIELELVGWIFMWMTNVRVQNPPILKKILLDKHREVLHDYETGKPLVSNNSFRAK